MNIVIAFIISYLLGAIPFGYIFTDLLMNKDVREYGSGNVGATNVTRVLGLNYGLIVGILDILKGFTAVWLVQTLIVPGAGNYIYLVAGLLAIIGHNWSIFLKFSGGKGVATTTGVILKLMPMSFLVFVGAWLAVVFLTKYVSLASIMAALSVPISSYFINNSNHIIIFTIIYLLLIVFTHRSNIKRLIQGRENKMSWPPDVGKSGN